VKTTPLMNRNNQPSIGGKHKSSKQLINQITYRTCCTILSGHSSTLRYVQRTYIQRP